MVTEARLPWGLSSPPPAGAIRRVHFVGIGGTGMCGLAEILLAFGYEVSGCDLNVETEAVERLLSLGARVWQGHDEAHLDQCDLLVISSAIRDENLELREAFRRGVPVLRRGQMLAEIMRLRQGIAVAGAHGKTTTTSLIGFALQQAGLDPTVVVGGRLRSLGSNARLGLGNLLVAEADESDGSFLEMLPTVAVVTNLDREHLDHYKNMAEIEKAFLRFARSVPFYGAAILCKDDERLSALAREVNRPVITYGLAEGATVRAIRVRHSGRRSSFDVQVDGKDAGEFDLALPGVHNVRNALATIAVAHFLQVDLDLVRDALSAFEGVGRRFEVRSEVAGVTHLDDYGHHPTELKAVVETARQVFGERRLVVLFQPHRYTRTAALHSEFASCFDEADLVVVTDIYAAGELPIEGISGETIVSEVLSHGETRALYSPRKEDVLRVLPPLLRKGDVLLTLGAGDVWKWGDAIMEAVGAEGQEHRVGTGKDLGEGASSA